MLLVTSLVILIFPSVDIGIIHLTNHIIFSTMVLANIQFFGEASAEIAMIANGIPLLVMNLSWNNWYFLKFIKMPVNGNLVYLCALCTPIVFEIIYKYYCGYW
jgi:hypothetical protein